MFLPENTMNGYQLKSNQSVHYGFQTALLPELFLYFQSSLTIVLNSFEGSKYGKLFFNVALSLTLFELKIYDMFQIGH